MIRFEYLRFVVLVVLTALLVYGLGWIAQFVSAANA